MDAADETPEGRQARQFAEMRELSELGMDLARDAHAAAKQQVFAPNPQREVDRAATFAAMANLVRAIVAMELRIERGHLERRPAPSERPRFMPAASSDATRLRRAPADPRRTILRGLLRHAARSPGGPSRRDIDGPSRRDIDGPSRRDIDGAIATALAADPDGDRSLAETFVSLCRDLHIDPAVANPAQLRDWVPVSPVPS